MVDLGVARAPSGRGGGVVTIRIASKAAAAAACAVAFSIFASTLPAEAAKRPMPAAKAPTAYASTKAPAAVQDPATTSSVAVPGPALDANCSKSRKRLWVEGEGWIVRRVTTCF
jgi:hypothetical protein